MMRDIRVFGEDELLALVEAGEVLPDHLISIGNPRPWWRKPMPGEVLQPAFRKAFRRVLRLSFFDVESPECLGPMRPRRVPGLGDARRVLSFWEGSMDVATGYVVHCWAGVSRSTAVTLALLWLETRDAAEAGRRLVAMRPEAGPNRLLAASFDRLLNAGLLPEAERIAQARNEALAARMREELDAGLEELEAWTEAPEEPGEG